MMRYVELGTLISSAKPMRCGTGEYPVLSMTMHDGLVFQDKKFKKVIASKDKSDYKVVYRNQLVISFPIDEGVLAAQRIADAGIVSPAYGIWDIDQSKVFPEYLEYALRCDRALQYYKAKLRGSTARRRTLPTPTLLAFQVPLPSMAEQEKKLNTIHQTNSIIEKREMQIKGFDDLIKARFVELFGDIVINPMGYREATVSEYCQMTQGTQIPMSEQISEYQDGYYRYLYIRDLKYDDEAWIYVLDQYEDKKLTADDLVVVNTGNTAGEIYRGKDGILSNNLFKVSFDTEILSTTYMFYYLKSDTFQHMLWSEMKEGTQPHLGHKIFGSKKLIVPPMALQEQFAAFVQQVDKSKAVVQKSLEETQLLFNSLMQNYFG